MVGALAGARDEACSILRRWTCDVKRLLIRLLAAVGLVPAGRYRALKRQADEFRAGTSEWKAKAREALDQVKKLSIDLKMQSQLVDQLQQRTSEFQTLQERLAAAERDLATAREQLMAVEVKLDILEGAANVLDTRTRSVVSRQRSGSSASA